MIDNFNPQDHGSHPETGKCPAMLKIPNLAFFYHGAVGKKVRGLACVMDQDGWEKGSNYLPLKKQLRDYCHQKLEEYQQRCFGDDYVAAMKAEATKGLSGTLKRCPWCSNGPIDHTGCQNLENPCAFCKNAFQWEMAPTLTASELEDFFKISDEELKLQAVTPKARSIREMAMAGVSSVLSFFSVESTEPQDSIHNQEGIHNQEANSIVGLPSSSMIAKGRRSTTSRNSQTNQR